MNNLHTEAAKDITTKEFLTGKTEAFKDAISKQIHHATEGVTKASKIAFIVGAAVSVSFVVYKLVSIATHSGNKRKVTPAQLQQEALIEVKSESQFIGMIKGAIASILLSIAREKLVEFLEALNAKYKESAANNQAATR